MNAPSGPEGTPDQPQYPPPTVPPSGWSNHGPGGGAPPGDGWGPTPGSWSGPAGAAVPPTAPAEVTISFWLWIVEVVVGLVGAVVAFLFLNTVISEVLGAARPRARNPELIVTVVRTSIIVGAVIGVVFVVLHVLFAVFMRRGRNWARIVLTVLGALGVVSAVVGLFTSSTVAVNGQEIATRTAASTVLSLVQAVIIIAAIVFSFRPAANAYFAAARRR